MLVLTRKPGERIHIGDDIVLSVVRVQGGRVRIGIDAPRECRILRAELRQFETAPGMGPQPHSETLTSRAS